MGTQKLQCDDIILTKREGRIMEKIKMDYLKFWLFSLCIYIPLFTIAVIYKVNQLSHAPIHLLVSLGIIIYLYILERFSSSGYFINHDGISYKNSLTPWDKISIRKDFFVWKILLQDRNKKIHFDKFHQKSIINLIKKYCPKNHEVYKTIEEYSEEKKTHFT